ncbi:MAG: VanZ family protein [Rubrivivax sp.]|nr:VanZ family protein [Rubrivivax sp.]
MRAALSRHRSSATPLALAFAALVIYASLFPFTGWRWPPGQSLLDLLRLPWPPWRDPFDFWANLLGYLPLGVLAMIAARRSGLALAPALALAVLGPALLSYATEVAQHFLPRRHPSLKDLAMNSLGALTGALLAAALQRAGAIDRWHLLRERWFVRHSAGALALLALWPLGLLFPAPLPLGQGQVGERLRMALAELLDDVPWAEAAQQLLIAAPTLATPLRPLAETITTALGLLGPILLAYAVVEPGWRRLPLALGIAVLGLLAMTLSTLLNFGPPHALAWLTPLTLPALVGAALLALTLAPVARRVAAGLALVALTGLVVLVAQAPADPYFAQSLRAWELGRWIHFYGLAQWIGWLWPYAAMAWLLTRLGARD